MRSQRLTRNQVASLLVTMGIIHTDSIPDQIRNDAGETASFLRALEFIQAEVYRVEYPELRALDFIPLDTSVPAGSMSFTIRIWDWFGQAKIISNYAADLPTVGLLAAEKSYICQTVGIGYDYSLFDIQGAALSGIPLDVEKAGAARRGHDSKIDSLAAFGDTAAGLPGFANHPNVTIMSAPGVLNGDWSNPATTPKMILDDLHYIANTTAANTRKIVPPDTLILPSNRYDRLATLRMSDYDATTVLRAFLDSSPYIKNVDQWQELDTADSNGTGPRAVCYRRDKKVVKLVLPQPFQQLPPQTRGMTFYVPCYSRIGGVVWAHPLAGTYVDGI